MARALTAEQVETLGRVLEAVAAELDVAATGGRVVGTVRVRRWRNTLREIAAVIRGET